MTSSWIADCKERFEELAFVKPEMVEGFSEEQIVAVEKELGKNLPGSYREFLRWAGRRAGCLMHDHRFGLLVHCATSKSPIKTSTVQEVIEEFADVFPADHLLITEHLGNPMHSVPLEEGDDPCIWESLDEDDPFVLKYPDFASFLMAEIEQAAKATGEVYVQTDLTLAKLAVPDDKVVTISIDSARGWSTLSEELRPFVNLKGLYASFSGLESVPSWLGELNKLEKLYLQHNNIRHLPDCFAGLTSLKLIMINGNPIEQLPPSIFRLPALETLDISGTLISELPDLNSLPSLRTLSASETRLSDLQVRTARRQLCG